MDYLKGWRIFREDPDFTSKMITGAVLFLSASCVPMVGQLILAGWVSLIVRRAVRLDRAGAMSPDPYRQEPVFGVNPVAGDRPIPRLDFDLNYLFKYLGSGFKVMVAQLVYVFPAIALVMVGGVCIYAGAAGVAVGGMTAGREVGSAIGILMMIIMGLGALLAPVILFASGCMARVAVMRVQITDDVGQAMKLKEVFEDAKRLPVELLILHFVQGLIGTAAIFAGMLLCGVGIYLAMVVVMVITAFHQSELYRISLSKGASELPLGPLDVEA